jgi:hypothetical protein
MTSMTRISSFVVFLAAMTLTSRAQDPNAEQPAPRVAMSVSSPSRVPEQTAKQWVWLAKQGVWGYGYEIQDGPHRGLWRVDPDSKVKPEDLTPTADPYGFMGLLNTYRAWAGLPPLAYDPDLSAWASHNNAAQTNYGLGHHVNPNCCQNSAWNVHDAESVATMWMQSPGHRANMLNPSVSTFGIAYGPGPYWTMNAR